MLLLSGSKLGKFLGILIVNRNFVNFRRPGPRKIAEPQENRQGARREAREGGRQQEIPRAVAAGEESFRSRQVVRVQSRHLVTDGIFITSK